MARRRALVERYDPRGRRRARNVAVHTLPRSAVSASFRPLETRSFENAAPAAACSPFFRLCCISARRAARNNEELGSFALETLVGLWTDDSPDAFLNRARFLKIYFRVLIQVLIYSGFFLQTYLPAQRVAMII